MEVNHNWTKMVCLIRKESDNLKFNMNGLQKVGIELRTH